MSVNWLVFAGLTGLCLISIALYLYRKREKRYKMEREDEWMESLPDEEWEVSDPWEDGDRGRGAGR